MDRPPPARRLASLTLLALLLLMPLACWSSDTLFINLTATPVPTLTPTSQGIDSRYKVGDTVTVPSQGVFGAVYLTVNPEPATRRNRVQGGVCNPGTAIPVKGVQQVDGVTYYLVECNNATGWTAESNLAPLGS
jgi:hypothetical protein